ncbi:hypothetical protein COCON_G00196570 [Conger conger]|uniref:Uncharacterized protein n=1 Tax=Conger conger TaxID=82655 RepID=A0A9Q1D230_CONCO|nr:urotensin II-related peptide [Conger conger]KAJ8255793.1 hypothetical protein COCON_G00196570 [Conger conger]
MQSAAGFRGLLAPVAVLVMEMAIMAVLVPAVLSAPFTPDQDPRRTSDGKALYAMPSSADTAEKTVSSISSPERREKFLKVLLALEELQRSISVGGKITMVQRGNKSSHRGGGKKNKAVVSEDAQRAATLPPVDGGGTDSGPSDRPPGPQNRGGKDIKKSHPQSPKKPNKRVCFWKYCSQN